MTWITFIDLAGTLVFAISGITAGIKKEFDIIGTLVLGIVTAVGGGTLRDLLIGSLPVGWLTTDVYIYVIFAAIPISYFFSKSLLRLRRSLFLMDTIGIALFTVLGAQKTLDAGLSPAVAVMLGSVSAVFGGVIRDVLANVEPLIFRREIYATACVAGGIVYVSLLHFALDPAIAMLSAMAVIVIVRYISMRYNWGLQIKVKGYEKK